MIAPRPSEEYDVYWLHVARKDQNYLRPTTRCGKWMVFIHVLDVDMVWQSIKEATEAGRLGGSAKVATMKPNGNAIKKDEKCICIYTYDSEDQKDVLRILTEIRNLNIQNKAFYKEDATTLAGQYSFNTGRSVSKWYAREGQVELLTPKGAR